MMYDSCEDYLNANMESAYKIAKGLPKAKREELELVLDFLKNKILEDNKITKWFNDAVEQTVTDDQYKMIMKLYMAYMNNDFITNCEWGKEMAEKGLLKPSGFTIFGKLTEED